MLFSPLRRHTPLVLLLAWLAVDMLLPFAAIPIHASLPHILESPVFIFPALAQIAALIGWLILGSSCQGWYGAALAAAVIALWAFGLDSELIGVELFSAVVWLLPLVALRVAGWSFRLQERPPQPARAQVSLSELVGLTTVAALTLGAWKALSLAADARDQRSIIVLGWVVLSTLPTILWPLLAWTRARHSLCIGVGIAVISAQLASLNPDWLTPRHPMIALAFVLLAFGLFMAHVLALRAAGYSLERKLKE
jgi:hypothetical protein